MEPYQVYGRRETGIGVISILMAKGCVDMLRDQKTGLRPLVGIVEADAAAPADWRQIGA